MTPEKIGPISIVREGTIRNVVDSRVNDTKLIFEQILRAKRRITPLRSTLGEVADCIATIGFGGGIITIRLRSFDTILVCGRRSIIVSDVFPIIDRTISDISNFVYSILRGTVATRIITMVSLLITLTTRLHKAVTAANPEVSNMLLALSVQLVLQYLRPSLSWRA